MGETYLIRRVLNYISSSRDDGHGAMALCSTSVYFYRNRAQSLEEDKIAGVFCKVRSSWAGVLLQKRGDWLLVHLSRTLSIQRSMFEFPGFHWKQVFIGYFLPHRPWWTNCSTKCPRLTGKKVSVVLIFTLDTTLTPLLLRNGRISVSKWKTETSIFSTSTYTH
jgi:hypothetical protein